MTRKQIFARFKRILGHLNGTQKLINFASTDEGDTWAYEVACFDNARSAAAQSIESLRTDLEAFNRPGEKASHQVLEDNAVEADGKVVITLTALQYKQLMSEVD